MTTLSGVWLPTEKEAPGFRLVKPDLKFLPEYVAALERGWSADTIRRADAAREELEKVERDPAMFVALLDDPEAKGDRGSGIVPRLRRCRRSRPPRRPKYERSDDPCRVPG
jgi:hypothetical protein